jgi:lipoprotein-anchoring transpeptidase ErfK/SrfK
VLVGRPVVVGALVLAAACGGGGGDDEDAGSDTATSESTTATTEAATATTAAVETAGEDPAPVAPTGTDISLVAQAQVPEVHVYAEPDTASENTHTLANPNENGAPLVFLVQGGQQPTGEWLEVQLPVRPNGTTGWVHAAEVRLAQHDYRIRVELGAHRLVLTEGGEVMLEAPIGVGTQDTPTPGGTYYVKELLQPPDPEGAYGPYAYGLSGFSNAVTSFAGGDGVIGIHGTNEPETVGTDVSHGCIRLTNDVVTQLAEVVPLGTPVEIVA